MCGIFALLNNRKSFSDDHINDSFMVGKKRGPEDSNLKSFDEKIILGFHRLAINGLNDESMQPIIIGSCTLICNGEIYNYKELMKMLDVTPTTDSDCEVIVHLYMKYGMQHTLSMLDGVFAFILLDMKDLVDYPEMYIARDPFGVRPLWRLEKIVDSNNNINNAINNDNENIFAISSDVKVLSHLLYGERMNADDGSGWCHYHDTDDINVDKNKICPEEYKISCIEPGTYMKLSRSFKIRAQWCIHKLSTKYYNIGYTKDTYRNSEKINYDSQLIAWKGICYQLNESVKKRVVGTTDRPIACLLSGGLDSSLITALVNKYYDGELETYSIGMKGSCDLKRAKEVASYLGTRHTTIEVTKEEFFAAIPEVIYAIESYDTTTVRASVGNYLVGKYISEHSEAKVIFNGDGSDELTGGYLYFLKSPSDLDFDHECRRLLNHISLFDVLRSDKSISSHGLEPRTPFLDKQFVDYYLSLPIALRNPLSNFHLNAGTIPCEKLLLRQAITALEPELLPKDIVWRTKEAFSDGVSGEDGSWFTLIDTMVNKLIRNGDFDDSYGKEDYLFNEPQTKEQLYYRKIFESYYPNMGNIIPFFWMPNFVNAKDSSARTLDIYNEKTKSGEETHTINE